jgi:hypothetical protein
MYKYYLIFSCFQLVQHVREKRTLKDVSPLVPFREFKVQIFLRHPPIECTRRHFAARRMQKTLQLRRTLAIPCEAQNSCIKIVCFYFYYFISVLVLSRTFLF